MSDGPEKLPGLSGESKKLLGQAARPRPMSLAERKLAAQSVAKIAAAPVAIGGALSAAKIAAGVASLGVAALVAQSVAKSPSLPLAAPRDRAAVTSAARSARALPEPSITPSVAPSVAPSIAPAVANAVPSVSSVISAPSEAAPRALAPVAPVAPRAATRGPSAPSTVVTPSSNAAIAPTVAPTLAPTIAPSVTPAVAERGQALSGSAGSAHSLAGGAAPEESPEQRETNSLGEVFAAVSSDPGRALAMLDAYDREFPRGRLRDEREFLGVLALQRLGRRDEARARADALLRRSPTGMYAPRLRRLLEQLQ